MTTLRHPITLAALAIPAALCSTSTAAAAPQLDRGMTFSWPNGLSATNTLPTLGLEDPTLLKHPLNQSTPPAAWQYVQALPTTPQVLSPDYSLAEIFGATIALTIQINGHSTGNDWIPPLDLQGVPTVGLASFNWLAYVVSVTNGSSGAEGSYIEQLNLSGVRPVGAELLGYYAAGSQNIAAELVGATTLEATALSQGYTNANVVDIDAVDFALGIKSHDTTAARMNWIFRNENQFFFTVTEAWASTFSSQYPSFAQDQGSLPVPPDSGTIYVTNWDPGALQWGPIYVYMDRAELGLDSVEDIDALAVNPETELVIFSTVKDTAPSSRPQLLVFQRGMAAPVEALDRDPALPAGMDTTPVITKLDLERGVDDIDGLCIVDPPELPRIYAYLGGVSVTSTARIANGAPELQNLMDISFTRGVDPLSGIDSLMVQASGWGGVTPQDSEVWLFTWTAGATVWPTPGYAILPNADPLHKDTAGGWAFAAAIPRTAGDDMTEARVPFPIGPLGTNAAIMAWLVTPSGNEGAGPQLLAGSLITEFGL